MGLKDLFVKKDNKAGLTYAPTMSGTVPFYSPFGDNIYCSDIIIQAIRCKSNEFKKLKPRHIRTKDGKAVTIEDSSIAKVLKRPNQYMTTADFLEKICILLELNKNVFIYPEFYMNRAGERVYTGLYPLKPNNVQYLADNSGEMYIKMSFATGYEAVLPVNSVIHWRKDYGVDDYFGGNLTGGNDDAGLLNMLKRYDQITQSIAKSLEISCQINGVMKVNTYLDDERRKAEREKFEDEIKKNKSGILFTDMSTEYTNIPRDIKLVDGETIKTFYEAILINTGVSLPILKADYTKEQKEAFYEHALEGDIISLGQAMSKCMFSVTQDSFGNEIVLYPNAITFMSMENKLAFAGIAAPAGMVLKDEFRELFGYPPLPDGQGQVIAQGYNSLLDENNNNINQKKKEG